MSDPRDIFENLVYRSVDRRRFTQRSPVMPDVWIRFGMEPGRSHDLLIIPSWEFTPRELARTVKQRLRDDREFRAGKRARFRASSEGERPRVAANQAIVVANLRFDEVVRVVLPLSKWWKDTIRSQLEGFRSERALRSALHSAIADGPGTAPDSPVGPELEWVARLAGCISHLDRQAEEPVPPDAGELEELVKDPEVLSEAFAQLAFGILPVEVDDEKRLFSVNLNRKSEDSVQQSTSSVKADAAKRLFDVTGKGIVWAVIDSGIDATHTAFRKRDEDDWPLPVPFSEKSTGRRSRKRRATRAENNTRVVKTYDFVHIRDLLGAEAADVDDLPEDDFPILKRPGKRDALREVLDSLDDQSVSWERLEPFLEVPHTVAGYVPPVNRHGTHVAGILGARWLASDGEDWEPSGEAEVEVESAPDGDLVGICPDIELYDLRALDDKGVGNEFAIMSALQFVRDLNSRRDFVAIHGVNLSFSIAHDVVNYACGRTPVCEEAERLVGNGTVVVAAAGNAGRARYLTPDGADDGFRTVSITDPGNAANAITVGATHRSDPHTYGVSYFSRRGPTGDGRLKPDLVAPGEKITSTVPGNAQDCMDGTSMAAPHVSGAAALIMARHSEFINQPRRIKQILCDSTTDLGREHYFQGAGLLDILRALESI